MSKHSPGPWIWNESGYSLRPAPEAPQSIYRTILELEHQGYVARDCDIEAMKAEGDANLKLIAAAPELLEALQLAEQFMRRFEGDENQVGLGIRLAIIRAAIAKAGAEIL